MLLSLFLKEGKSKGFILDFKFRFGEFILQKIESDFMTQSKKQTNQSIDFL